MHESDTLSPELIAEIKSISIKAKHLVNTTFAGDYECAFKGRGMTFEEVREYAPGDDVRKIDWNVTARTRKPFVKLFRDERELSVLFMLDVSASNRFGSATKFKNRVAAEVAAILTYMASRNNDKVGLVIFAEEVELFIPPKKGRGHTFRIIRELLTYKSQARKTNFTAPFKFINQVIKNRSVLFCISDFIADDFEQDLKATARSHELIAIKVSDDRETMIPKLGYIEFEDAESGESLLINTSDASFQQRYADLILKNNMELSTLFLTSGVDLIEVTTDSYVEPLVSFFRQREKRSRK